VLVGERDATERVPHLLSAVTRHDHARRDVARLCAGI
jgi:hypothetical protein